MVIIVEDVKLDFADVLIRPKRSTLASRSEVDLNRTFITRWSKREWSGVPVIAANMDTTGTFAMARTLAANRMFTALHKFYTAEEYRNELTQHPEIAPFVAVSSGTSQSDLAVMREVINTTAITTICLDVANGYSEHFVDCIRKVREEFPTTTIMAGNVCTAEMTEELVLSGADAVKVGIGPGSVCTTRRQTGVGYPQLSAIIECADAAHGLNGLVVADGGCVVPGDVAKAFAAGADFTMLGSFFAAHDESNGELVERDGKKYKLFYGMSSATAMQKYKGGVAEYRSSEGKTVEVPYRGPVQATVNDLLGGVRSTCTYVGAAKLKELSKRTTFIRVSRQLNTVYGNP